MFFSLIKNQISYGLFLVFIMGASLISCSSEQQRSIQALLITGGGWHDYEEQERLLTEGVKKRLGDQIEWTIVHEGDGEPDYHVSILKEENWAEKYDVVVHNTGFGRVTDSEFLAHFVEHHKGTPAVLIHAAVHSYRFAEHADPWFKLMGLQSMAHERQREFELENVAPDHPIMRGFPDRWMTPVDEIYIVKKLWGDIVPLVRAWGPETEEFHPVTWTYEFNNTKVFATTLGHNNDVFEEEIFKDMITNGILWAVEKL